MARFLAILACSMILIGADAPTGEDVFRARGDSFCRIGTEQALRQAVIEYTSAILDRPRDGRLIGARAAAYAELGEFRPAIHDANTALMYGNDELAYYYVVGRSKPSIECLRRAYRLACWKGDQTLIPAIGKLLLFYEVRYPYVTEEGVYP